MFELEHEVDGKVQVPVLFSVNGICIVREGGLTHIECGPTKPRYPYIGFDCQNSVLAKVKTTMNDVCELPRNTKKFL